MNVLHVITGLGSGGAEGVLFRLISATRHKISHTVISMLDDGEYGKKLRNFGIPIHTLKARSSHSATLLTIPRLIICLRKFKPDVVQTWMYHADLIGGIAAKLARNSRVAWNIRHASLQDDKLSTQYIAKIGGVFSKMIPDAIICNSIQASLIHQQIGYDKKRFCLIPNGFDLARLKPDSTVRNQIRQSFNLLHDDFVVGMVARWNIHKDHDNFLQSFAASKKAGLKAKGLLVGPGINDDNVQLRGLIRQHHLDDDFILAGSRQDIPDIMNALDLHVLSSSGEAFPNVVAEAMACGTPCVVTDVGDAAMIVGNPDWVVPPKRPDLLAEAIGRAIETIRSEGRVAVGARCRERIVDNFSLERMVNAYTSLWSSLVNEQNPCASSS